jgi:hypothetical protein
MGKGCQTALFEAKTDMDARESRTRTYHQIFLDLPKAFKYIGLETTNSCDEGVRSRQWIVCDISEIAMMRRRNCV